MVDVSKTWWHLDIQFSYKILWLELLSIIVHLSLRSARNTMGTRGTLE